jgi:hypothetical protein
MRSLVALVLVLTACGDDAPGNTVYFDLEGSIAEPATFWNLPFPSDLRLAESGAPDLTGFPNPRNVPILNALLTTVGDRKGWPVMPVAYFRFTAPVPEQAITELVPAGDPRVALLDIDPDSAEYGSMHPIVATTLPPDPYVPSDLVAFAPRPGIVLRANTRYAYVVRTAFAPGFSAPPAFATLIAGREPAGARGSAAAATYAPLWSALEMAGIDKADVLAATVFTTSDEVARTHARSEAIRTVYEPAIEGLTLVGGATLDGFCQLSGTITMPQFQKGLPPFDNEGRFDLDGNDVPMMQRTMTIPLTITVPKRAMPATGWPLYQFIHGSGGLTTGLVDLGYASTPADMPEPGKGPGYIVALHGIAAASAAMPVNPERQPGASDYAYLNINNLSSFPSTFQQGVFEQRLFLDALLALQIPHATLAGCGAPAPTGNVHRFDPATLTLGGQSMGGMYTNMVGAVEPRFGALVPTGAGGFWNLMILQTSLVPGARALLGTALGLDDATLSFVHPALDVLALGWEIADPLVYMARLGRRPLPGMPARHVYEPIGKDDENFPNEIYDACALAYGNEQAGTQVWPTLQEALAIDDLAGVLPYPVKGNLDGKTRVVVQFPGDGIISSHYLYRQNAGVKHQYGCFLESYVRDGVPTVPAPGAITDPCP